MNKKQEEKLGAFIRQVAGYKPQEKPRQPSNPPPKAELSRRWGDVYLF